MDEVLLELKNHIDEYGRRLGELERKVSFLVWFYLEETRTGQRFWLFRAFLKIPGSGTGRLCKEPPRVPRP
jgi:hypothetical protein